MMELLKQWLVGITCAALAAALADGLAPKGSGKQIVRLAGGLLLLLAVVKPLAEADLSSLAASVSAQVAWEQDDGAWEEANLGAMKIIIGERTGAYILDKAAELGAACEMVSVECAVGEENIPYPAAVTVTGTLTPAQKAALIRIIEADLAISEACQTYVSGRQTP